MALKKVKISELTEEANPNSLKTPGLNESNENISSDVVQLINNAKETTQTILQKIGDGSQISSSYLPSYVDDVIEVADFASLPGTGEQGKIYVTIDDNASYRWSGSAYVSLSNPLDYVTQPEVETSNPTENTKVTTILRVFQGFVHWVSNVAFATLNTTSKNLIGAVNEVFSGLSGKQDTLVSGTNIKTINGESILGSGNIGVLGGEIVSRDNAFSTGLDFTLNGADKIYYNRGIQSGDLTFTISNNPTKSNVFIRTSFETDGNNIILPSVIEKSLVANEYANDVGIYFLLIHWDGSDFVTWITKIRDVDIIAPTITGFTLDVNNSNVIVRFSEGVNITGAGLKITNPIYDSATAFSISSIEKVGGGALIGGEDEVQCNLNITGTPSGSEKFEIQPFDGASISDLDSNFMSSAQTTGTITLYDGFTLQAITVTDNVGLTVSAGVSGTNIQKTGATELWDSGCASVEVINSGIGWLEFIPKKVNNTAYGMIVGLSDSNPNANETQIDYGLLVLSDDIYKIENNSATLLNTAGSADGQTFRVKMTPSGGSNAVVTYEWKVNGIWEVLGTSAVVATYPLLMDCSLIRDGASNVNQVTVEEIGFKGVDIV